MKTNEIIDSLEQTLTTLRILENELYRPKEDVVTLSVCLRVRHSLISMLRLYLESREVNYEKDASLNDLLIQCKSIDTNFETVDFAGIDCKDETNSVCSGECYISPEKVADCLVIANHLKSLIVDKINTAKSK